MIVLFLPALAFGAFCLLVGWFARGYHDSLLLDRPSDILDRLGDALDDRTPPPRCPRNLRLVRPAEFVDARARGWV